jgi:ABC-type glycerol-3-phosphate transport system substrate-binding protein
MKKNSRLFVKAMALLLALVMTVGLAGCGGSNGDNGGEDPAATADGSERTVIYYQASYISAQVQAAYQKMVETYNNGQGITDGVYVQMRESSGAVSGLDSALRANYQYDVLELRDDEFKTLAMQGGNFFVTLDEYMTEEAKTAMQYDQIPAPLMNRFRMNTTPSENGKFLAGEGASLLALPIGNNPHILFYNKAILENCGINVISVPEEELDAYNAANGTSLKPHGYAEYKDAPYADAKSSRNEAGEFVYKIFNECIPMSWEEQRLAARACQNQFGYEHGYLSEWWFNYGFGVGGDCVGWDEAANQYRLTLGDKQPGYLALTDITVNGRSYAKGDVLTYESKLFLNNNASELKTLEGKVYKMPSMYDAILEFTRLAVPTDKQADVGVYGYGISPITTQNRTTRFTSGTVAFYVESFSETQSFKGVLGDALGMSLPAQYREYIGGSTYEKNGVEYLKVIGETYDGEVYTGDLKVENGTPITGEVITDSEGTGLFIPANTKNKNYEAAFKFASWVAGPEGQKILAEGNRYIPNQTEYALGEYAGSADRLIPNAWAGAYSCQKAEIGDYTYFTSLTWITEWSMTFNSDVREGRMTLTDFFAQKQEVADTGLRGMRLLIQGR